MQTARWERAAAGIDRKSSGRDSSNPAAAERQPRHVGDAVRKILIDQIAIQFAISREHAAVVVEHCYARKAA
jgi:hypothetical protein